MKITLRFFAALSVCALATTSSVRPAHAITDEEEIAAGRQMAQQAIREFGQPLSPNDPRQQRVSRIGAMFVRNAERRNIPYSFTVLQNDKVLNAFAGPGGPIFVTTKLIATAQNDAELAYVIGHEVGHIDRRHIVKGAQKAQTLGIGAAILGGLLGGRGRNGDLVGGLVNVGAGLWQKGFSRKDENESDDYGIRAMARLGFDPRAAVSMLGKLGDGPEGLGKYLSDHPTSKARQKKVQDSIAKDNLLAIAQNNGGAFLSLSGSNAGYAPTYGAGYEPVEAANDAPFRGRLVREGDRSVVLVPVAGMARLARVQVSSRGDGIAVRTNASGSTSGVFRADSNQATINGQSATMSSRARRISGQIYAPVGAVATALGARASLQGDNATLITFADGTSTVVRF